MTEYTRRQLRNVTRLALTYLITGKVPPDTPPGLGHLDIARAALAQLDGQAKPDLREPYVYRVRLQPGLRLTVDASHNIILEVRSADEAELTACRAERDAAEQDAAARHQAELFETMAVRELAVTAWPGEDADSRLQAVSELLRAGLPARSVGRVLKRAYGHLGGSFNVPGSEQMGTTTYDRETGTYRVRLPEAEQARQLCVVEEADGRWRERAGQMLDKPGQFEPRPGE
jgi:hypothetical protein